MAGLLAHDIIATTDGVGSQKDLLDYITIVDSRETPLFSTIKKGGKKINLHFEWPVDIEEEPGQVGVVEDATADVNLNDIASASFDNAQSSYTTLAGRCQWFRRVAAVSKLSQDVQNQAGIKSHVSYAITKKLLQVRRDIEVQICSDDDCVVGTASLANMTRGLGVWISPAGTVYTAGYDIPTAFEPTSGQFNTDQVDNGTLTETGVRAVLQAQYENVGQSKTYTLLCGPELKKAFANFTQTQFALSSHATDNLAISTSSGRVFNQDSNSRKIINTVDVYEGDFGTYMLVPTLFNAYYDVVTPANTAKNTAAQTNIMQARGYVLDMDKLELSFNQYPTVQMLPDQGAGPRFAVDAIAGMCVKNPAGLAKFHATA